MERELAKSYNPREVEERIYSFWENNGYFHAEVNPDKKPYTIVMPPPNITGQLHMGHALDNTLQDILIRWRRMQGYEALWVPGTDHASIATEAKIVEAMRQEGITKEDLGRDKFLERAWEWKEQYGGRIVSQLRKIGSSCDWERERFTMDDGCSDAVREVFVRLYNEGKIYRGERIINWCPHCLTSISDAEVEFEEKDAFFYHLRYPMADGSGYLELATTRPETMLGDTAVAVHPEDERYKDLVGKNVILPLVNKEIPIVADEYVERDFGTGVVKITPAHDPNDFEVGLRHGLEVITVTTDDGHMNEKAGKYEGLTISEARKAVMADLEEQGYVVKIEPMKHNVGTCYRCHTVVEPRVSLQWFVKMEELAKPAIEAVKTGKTKFVPERFDKIYFHWLENIRDWCISRQLWWGHRIPAWYCPDCGETIVSKEDPTSCPKCGSKKIVQDEDTLDTWFSSALWPFSTMGWPKDTDDYKYFYPTETMVTGYDIIFFWVVRMMFSGLAYTGDIPFHTVFIHGLVRDSQGRKMSKSLGNGIDPLEIIDQYGADALRFMLATGNSPGNDMRFIQEKVESSRNFANKIWNAARFILMNLDGDIDLSIPENLQLEDKWILSKLNSLIKAVTENLEKFELGMAVQKLYDFIWDDFCDWYIELCKTRLQGEKATEVRQVLVYVMTNMLKLLHPFMPFITEEIWQTLPHTGETLMRSEWPVYDENLSFPEQEKEMERLMEAIRAIRNRRAEMNVPPSKKTELYIETSFEKTFEEGKSFMQRLAFANEIYFKSDFEGKEGSISIVTPDATIRIPMEELVDLKAELARLEKERLNVQKQLDGVNARLSNEAFVSKAPQNVVDGAKDQARRLQEKLDLLDQSMKSLQK